MRNNRQLAAGAAWLSAGCLASTECCAGRRHPCREQSCWLFADALPCLHPAPAGAAAAQLAALDKAHTMRQLGVGTPANSILGILCDCDGAGGMEALHAGGRAGGQEEEGEEEAYGEEEEEEEEMDEA